MPPWRARYANRCTIPLFSWCPATYFRLPSATSSLCLSSTRLKTIWLSAMSLWKDVTRRCRVWAELCSNTCRRSSRMRRLGT